MSTISRSTFSRYSRPDDLMRTVVLAVLAVTIVTGWVNIAVVLVVMFLLGTAETFADTT
jgi:hypothetical protein